MLFMDRLLRVSATVKIWVLFDPGRMQRVFVVFPKPRTLNTKDCNSKKDQQKYVYVEISWRESASRESRFVI